MQNEELFEEIDTTGGVTQEYLGLSFKKVFSFHFYSSDIWCLCRGYILRY